MNRSLLVPFLALITVACGGFSEATMTGPSSASVGETVTFTATGTARHGGQGWSPDYPQNRLFYISFSASDVDGIVGDLELTSASVENAEELTEEDDLIASGMLDARTSQWSQSSNRRVFLMDKKKGALTATATLTCLEAGEVDELRFGYDADGYSGGYLTKDQLDFSFRCEE
jgi:hypothetical protein